MPHTLQYIAEPSPDVNPCQYYVKQQKEWREEHMMISLSWTSDFEAVNQSVSHRESIEDIESITCVLSIYMPFKGEQGDILSDEEQKVD